MSNLLLTGVGNQYFSAGVAPTISRTASDGASGNNCGATMACTFSPAPASGKLLIAVINDNTGITPSAPSGGGAAWTELGSGSSVRVWYKIANGSEPTSYTITFFGTAKADSATFTMFEISGNFSTPIDSNSTSSASTAISPSITTQFNFELVLSILADGSSGTNPTEPSGWTLSRRDSYGLMGVTSLATAYKTYNTAGATGTATWGSSTSPAKIFTIGVRSQ